jgi:neuronal cell adhesion protein
MDKKDYDPSGLDGRVAIQPGVGTLIFARPLARDEGYYQCFAKIDKVGTAVSYMVHMRQAGESCGLLTKAFV